MPTELVARGQAIKQRQATEGQNDIPDLLLQPGGIIDDITAWIIQTAIRPQPIFALANTLVALGAVFGRKVRTKTDIRTNLSAISIGHSGSGKDHSRKCIERLLEEAGYDQIIGGEDLASDAGILSAVTRSPSTLFQFDEIGHFINSASDPKAAAHLRLILPVLMKLHSSANKKYRGKEYADQAHRPRVDIVQPNVCIYGTSVPGRLFEGITEKEISDGFLARILLFSSERVPPKQKGIPSDPPPHVVEFLKAWANGPADGNLAAPNVGNRHMQPSVFTVKETPEAEAMFSGFESLWEDE